MIWAQGAACFLIWVAYGAWLKRCSEHLRRSMQARTRSGQVLISALCFLGSIIGMLGGLLLLESWSALKGGSLTPWGWLGALVLGLGFVHLQVLGVAALITLVQRDETERTRIASERQSNQRSSKSQ